MSNVVSSAIFCARNAKKAETQDKPVRGYIAVGQGAKVFDYATTVEGKVGEQARTAKNWLDNATKGEKLLDWAGRAVNFAKKYINPLICVSAGVDVLTSDDKQSALITNGTALGAMFGVEHLMKKHLDEIPKMKQFEGITKNVMDFATKHKMEGKLPAIIHGVAFVVGSCASYSIGQKFGDLLTGKSAN